VTLQTDNHILLSREPATDRVVECIHAFLSAVPEGPQLRGRPVPA